MNDIKAYASICASALPEDLYVHIIRICFDVCGSDSAEWIPDKKEIRNIKYLCSELNVNFKDVQKAYLDSLTWYEDDLLGDDLKVETIDKDFKDFEENSARARLMYVGRIFVSGFSDGVKEVDGSEGTNFYLQLKGTKDDLFDLDYVYIELIDNKQYANIKKGQPIIASGKLGEVRFLGASLEDSKIIIK